MNVSHLFYRINVLTYAFQTGGCNASDDKKNDGPGVIRTHDLRHVKDSANQAYSLILKLRQPRHRLACLAVITS